MRAPEEIRVLPSLSGETPQSIPSHRRRSKSQPRHGYSPPGEPAPPLPLFQPESSQHNPQPQMIHPRNVYQHPIHPRAPQVTYSQSHPMYQRKDPYVSRYSENLSHHNRVPPAIVYAPGTHSRGHYAPPTIIHHPHGAPIPQYPHHGGTPFSLAQGGLASVDENAKRSIRAARALRGHAGAHPEDMRSQTPSSQNSGSTYYVLPSPGQKVQIVPPDRSMYTATSTTQSPSPTHSGFNKKPFFARFFNIAEKLTSGDSQSRTSSSSGKRLQRRHSLGPSSKSQPIHPR